MAKASELKTKEERIAEIRRRLGVSTSSPEAKAYNNTVKDVESRIKRLEALDTPEPTEREGILTGLVKGLGTGIARTGVTAYNFVTGLTDLAGAAGRKLAGDDKGAQQKINDAYRNTHAKRNLPIFGELAPVGDTGNLRTNIKDILGTGLDVGSVVVGGGAGGKVLSSTLKGAVKEGAKSGLRYGALFGGASEAGKALQEDKSAIDVLKDAAKGAAAGAAFGGALGAGGAAVGVGARTLSRTKDAISDFVENSTKLKTVKNVAKGLAEKGKAYGRKLEGTAQTIENNAEIRKAARLQYEALPEPTKAAMRQGVMQRDSEFLSSITPEENPIFKKVLDTAENYEKLRTNDAPSKVLGEQVLIPLKELKKATDDASEVLNGIVRKAGNQKLNAGEVANDVIESMQGVRGLNGITIKQNGQLDFTNTALSGSLTKSERKTIQDAFNDALKKRDAQTAHKLRQELFEELGGRTKAGIKTNETASQGLNAIRQGLAKSIGRVSKGYEDANKKVAQLLDAQKKIAKYFGEVKEGQEDIFQEKAGILLRRLTSNTQSGQDIASALKDMEEILMAEGIKPKVSLVKLQEFANLLNRYFDISKDTSLQGIIESSNLAGGSGAVMKALNEITELGRANPETAKMMIKKLLDTAQK